MYQKCNVLAELLFCHLNLAIGFVFVCLFVCLFDVPLALTVVVFYGSGETPCFI